MIACLVVLGTGHLLAACSDDEGATDSRPSTTERPEPEAARPDSTEPNQAVGAANLELNDPLDGSSTNFQLTDFGEPGRSEYTGDAYRLTSLRRPLFTPLQDSRFAPLTSATVSVELTTISGFGTAGITCGLDRSGSYMFTIGRNESGETSVVIGRYDATTGMPASPNQAGASEALRRLELPPLGTPMTIGASCEPGDRPNEAHLTMTLDGEEVLSLTANQGGATGQVGLFDWGQGPEALITDFASFTVSGSAATPS